MNAPAPPHGTHASAISEDWWNGFHDAVLSTIVTRALDQDLDLAKAQARLDQARAAARAARLSLLPHVSAETQAAGLRQSLQSPIGAVASEFPGYERDQSLFDAGLVASWEVDLFGGRRRSAQAASAELQAAAADTDAARVVVAAAAADAYLSVREAQVRLALTTEDEAHLARQLGLTWRRLQVGEAGDLDLERASALVQITRASRAELRIALEMSLNRLDVLMGAQPGTYRGLLKVEAGLPQSPEIRDIPAPAALLRRRPDIVAAERRVAASNARIGQAIANYYPKLSLSGLLGFESFGVGNLFRGASFQPQGIAGLRWRLFDFGRVDAEVATARGRNAEALAAYRQTVLRACEDVENALASLVQRKQQIEALDRQIASLVRARSLAELSYAAGVSAYLDVIDAERALISARQEQARAVSQANMASVALFRAFGGGWT